MQKARSQAPAGTNPRPALLPLVGVRFQALFHSPHGGAFHLSLTVLVRYRSHGSSLALEGGPPSFTPDSSCRALLRNSTRSPALRRLQGSHLLWRPVPGDFGWTPETLLWVLQPRSPPKGRRFGLLTPVARRY